MSASDPDATALLSSDTTREAERRQVLAWREMTSVERAALISSASHAVRELALAGLRQRHPGASERMLIARFALLTLGSDLARAVYPELGSGVADSGGR